MKSPVGDNSWGPPVQKFPRELDCQRNSEKPSTQQMFLTPQVLDTIGDITIGVTA
jgi:hypothetical protein